MTRWFPLCWASTIFEIDFFLHFLYFMSLVTVAFNWFLLYLQWTRCASLAIYLVSASGGVPAFSFCTCNWVMQMTWFRQYWLLLSVHWVKLITSRESLAFCPSVWSSAFSFHYILIRRSHYGVLCKGKLVRCGYLNRKIVPGCIRFV